MAPLITQAAGLILPEEQLDASQFTLASVVIGDDAIKALVHAARKLARGDPAGQHPCPKNAGRKAYFGCDALFGRNQQAQ